jgi:NAD(P)-dependent dehydrogenase (short-subunit alcohol dehydrogenase family)
VTGRTAVITGGGRGVGAAVAGRLATAGVAIVVAARTTEQVEAVADRLRAEGHTAHAETCDVEDPVSVERLAARAVERLGRIDILVNNAGAAFASAVHKTTLEDWNRLLATNATSAFLCLRAVLPGMMERRWGRVVNVASIAGLRGDRYIAAYAASKHALVGLTTSAAAEAAPHGVTVNAVCPGYLHTDMTRDSVARIMRTTGRTEQQALEAILQTTPQKRLIEPAEVADAIAYLCSDGAAGVNGATLVIDGGELRR